MPDANADRYKHFVTRVRDELPAPWLVYAPATGPALQDDLEQRGRFWNVQMATNFARWLDEKEGRDVDAPRERLSCHDQRRLAEEPARHPQDDEEDYEAMYAEEPEDEGCGTCRGTGSVTEVECDQGCCRSGRPCPDCSDEPECRTCGGKGYCEPSDAPCPDCADDTDCRVCGGSTWVSFPRHEFDGIISSGGMEVRRCPACKSPEAEGGT